MTVEMTPYEAEILIAVLTGAEAAFGMVNPPLVEAMKELRPFRSALLQTFLRQAFAQPPSINAVDPVGGKGTEGPTRAASSSCSCTSNVSPKEPTP